MPTIDCDPATARAHLEDAGVRIDDGNTAHERWRAEREGAVAVAYDDKVVVQGSDPTRLTALLSEGGGRAHVYFDGASRGNPVRARSGGVWSPRTESWPRAASGSAASPTIRPSTPR